MGIVIHALTYALIWSLLGFQDAALIFIGEVAGFLWVALAIQADPEGIISKIKEEFMEGGNQ